MAVITAKFTRERGIVKAGVRYIQHRKGREGQKRTRELFGIDGVMERQQAYQLIDDAAKGTVFFHIVISPHPEKEDAEKDLHLAEITRQTMLTLEAQLKKEVPYVAAEHDDHTAHRHVHLFAVVRGRVMTKELAAMRETATQTALLQRQERDRHQEQQQSRLTRQQQREGGELALQQ
jgi:hypothetical protein